MIVATFDLPQKRYKHLNRHWLIAKCDVCSKLFIIKHCIKQALNHDRHMCCKVCSKKAFGAGGIVRTDIARRLKEEFGVNNIAARPDVHEKIVQTNRKKRGVDHPFKSKEVNEKRRKTYKRKYGVDWASKAPEVIEKQRQTLASKSPEEKEITKLRKQQTIKNRTPEEKEQSKRQRETTCVDRYGVPHVTQRPEHKARANSPEACKKRHETMKRNGTYGTSKAEEILYELLCHQFGIDDVERQLQFPGKKWSIDFYVKSINVYLQEDGIYWHGLNRPLEEIMKFKKSRDKQIYKKYLTDREQDEWFKANNKCLIRITDEEIKTMGSSVMNKLNEVRV